MRLRADDFAFPDMQVFSGCGITCRQGVVYIFLSWWSFTHRIVYNIAKSHPFPSVRDIKRNLVCNAHRIVFADFLIRQIIGIYLENIHHKSTAEKSAVLLQILALLFLLPIRKAALEPLFKLRKGDFAVGAFVALCHRLIFPFLKIGLFNLPYTHTGGIALIILLI